MQCSSAWYCCARSVARQNIRFVLRSCGRAGSAQRSAARRSRTGPHIARQPLRRLSGAAKRQRLLALAPPALQLANDVVPRRADEPGPAPTAQAMDGRTARQPTRVNKDHLRHPMTPVMAGAMADGNLPA